ncbi:MAG: hypothetical protein RR514_03410 [Christensenella sp.]
MDSRRKAGWFTPYGLWVKTILGIVAHFWHTKIAILLLTSTA